MLFFIWTWPVAAQSEDASANLVLACDRAAASPSDDNRPAGIAGVPSGKLDPQYAIPACQAAAAAAPDEPRLMFELGRAQTAAKDYAAARPQFSRASDLSYLWVGWACWPKATPLGRAGSKHQSAVAVAATVRSRFITFLLFVLIFGLLARRRH